MSKNIETKLARRIKSLREKNGYTQQYLSELSHIDYKHIQRLESGNPPSARIDTLEKIANAFGISVSQLLDF